MAAFSSDGRLSFTWLSSLPQNGQRIVHSSCVHRLDVDAKSTEGKTPCDFVNGEMCPTRLKTAG
jgi:hypothetical protein